MPGSLTGRVAIVTGGNSGIGEATVHRLAREGAKVALLARRQAEGEAVQQAVRAAGGDALFIACDVLSRPSMEAAVAQVVAHYGALHLLFNNAGGARLAATPEEDEAAWTETLHLNLTSTYLMTRLAWPHLVAAGSGSIVNMSSFAAVVGVVVTRLGGTTGPPPPQAYGAAKAGIEALTRTTASVGAPVNIRCNAVRPGVIGPRAHQNFKQVFEPIQLLPGAGAFTDIANAVYFLVSDEARFITGQILDINGGAAGKL